MSLVYSETVGGRTHGLYLGGKADAKSRDRLQRWGVTHILNVTPPKEASIQAGVANYFENNSKNSYTYKRIAVYDASTSNLLEHANEIVAFISSGLCHGSVLVHCQRGVSRSATCVAFYLMRKVGMNLTDSMTLIRQKRPEAEPIPAFMSQLQQYEQTCVELGVQIKVQQNVVSSSSAHKQRLNPNNRHCPEKEERQRASTAVSSSSTKKRPIVGPAAGPQPSNKKKRGAMIGPELPPTLQQQQRTPPELPLVATDVASKDEAPNGQDDVGEASC